MVLLYNVDLRTLRQLNKFALVVSSVGRKRLISNDRSWSQESYTDHRRELDVTSSRHRFEQHRRTTIQRVANDNSSRPGLRRWTPSHDARNDPTDCRHGGGGYETSRRRGKMLPAENWFHLRQTSRGCFLPRSHTLSPAARERGEYDRSTYKYVEAETHGRPPRCVCSASDPRPLSALSFDRWTNRSAYAQVGRAESLIKAADHRLQSLERHFVAFIGRLFLQLLFASGRTEPRSPHAHAELRNAYAPLVNRVPVDSGVDLIFLKL